MATKVILKIQWSSLKDKTNYKATKWKIKLKFKWQSICKLVKMICRSLKNKNNHHRHTYKLEYFKIKTKKSHSTTKTKWEYHREKPRKIKNKKSLENPSNLTTKYSMESYTRPSSRPYPISSVFPSWLIYPFMLPMWWNKCDIIFSWSTKLKINPSCPVLTFPPLNSKCIKKALYPSIFWHKSLYILQPEQACYYICTSPYQNIPLCKIFET